MVQKKVSRDYKKKDQLSFLSTKMQIMVILLSCPRYALIGNLIFNSLVGIQTCKSIVSFKEQSKCEILKFKNKRTIQIISAESTQLYKLYGVRFFFLEILTSKSFT